MGRIRLQISKVDGHICVAKDFSSMDRGESAHILAELEIIKEELLDIFESFTDDDSQMKLNFGDD